MWKSRSIQVVWFCANRSGHSASSIYGSFFDDEPDMTQRNRAVGPGPTSVAQGTVEDLTALVQVSPGRIDLILQPSVPEDDDGETHQAFDTVAGLNLVSAAARRNEVDFEDVSRLSIVAALSVPADDLVGASTFFKQYVGVDISDGDSDLLFQVNRRAVDPLPNGSLLNRVMRVQVAAERKMLVKMGAGDGSPDHIPLGQDLWSTRVQFDFNNVPDERVMNLEMQRTMLDEIASRIISSAEKESLREVLA